MSSLLVLVAVAVALGIGYAFGRALRGGAAVSPATPAGQSSAALPAPQPVAAVTTLPPAAGAPIAAEEPPVSAATAADRLVAERTRIVRSYEAEGAALRRALVSREAAIAQLGELAAERRRLFADLAAARAETARYRQFVIDLENNAPPPLFGTGAPDDLKLIVGVGPVLERMLHQLGVMTYRQIGHWSERDIDEFDAKLHEFPGRIRRDAWVTQARALHQSKYGETLPARSR